MKFINVIDTHAHAWSTMCKIEKNPRYTPSNHSNIEKYINVLNKNGIYRGVLVQPSFLGTNNDYLIKCLKKYKKRLRGIVVIDFENPQIEHLRKYAEAGVVGVRFNLNGQEIPDFSLHKYDKLFEDLKKLDWLIQVTAKQNEWLKIMPNLLNRDVKIVVDHFGKPDENDGINCEGFRTIIESSKSKKVWIKLSAPYRFGCIRGSLYAKELIENVSPYRILWGSDYPWTRHDKDKRYHTFITMIDKWFPHKKIRDYATYKNALNLYKFNTPHLHTHL